MSDTPHENWKQVVYKGQPLNYDVSDMGNVRSHKTGRLMRVGLTRGGTSRTRYRIVSLYDPRKWKVRENRRGAVSIRVARLVADAFLRPRVGSEQIEHDNQNSLDDRAANLKIVPGQSENIRASYEAGGRKKPRYNGLTQADYARIFELHKQGLSQVQIGRIIGCSNSNVSKVLSGRNGGPRIRCTTEERREKDRERDRRWRLANQERVKEVATAHRRRKGILPRVPLTPEERRQRDIAKQKRRRETMGEEAWLVMRREYTRRSRERKKRQQAALVVSPVLSGEPARNANTSAP